MAIVSLLAVVCATFGGIVIANAIGAPHPYASVYETISMKDYLKTAEMKKDFYADMIVNDRILLELKAVSSLNAAHERQLVSYMKSTGIREGMLLNFGNVRRLEWRAVQ